MLKNLLFVLTVTLVAGVTGPSAIARTPDGTGGGITIVPILNMPSAVGAPGMAVEYATWLYLGDHGRLPTQVTDLQPYMPFTALAKDCELVLARRDDGTEQLLLTRLMESGDPILAPRLGLEYTPRGSEGFEPAIGIHGDLVRLTLWSLMPADSADSLRLAGDQSHNLAADVAIYPAVQGQLPAEAIVTTGVPAQGREVRRLAALAATVGESARIQASFYQDNDSSLLELAQKYGGVNSAAWTNPYTDAPMTQVPLSAKSAGDYTDLSSSAGVLLGFHYLDQAGQISTFWGGYQSTTNAPGLEVDITPDC